MDISDSNTPNFEITELKDGYKLINYKKFTIYIIENIIEDEVCEKLINLINRISLEKTIINKQSNVRCYHNELNKLLQLDDRPIYEFSNDPVIFDKLLNNLKKGEILYHNEINGISHKELLEYKKIFDKKTKVMKNIMKDKKKHLCFDYNSGYILRKIFDNTNIHQDGLTSLIKPNKNDNNSYNDLINNEPINNDIVIVRNVSAIFTLNDDYYGGEFIFPDFELTIKLKKGSVIMFPPYYTHLHGTNKLLNNTYRYTVNTWYGEKLEG